jgi:hypothetical protein
MSRNSLIDGGVNIFQTHVPFRGGLPPARLHEVDWFRLEAGYRPPCLHETDWFRLEAGYRPAVCTGFVQRRATARSFAPVPFRGGLPPACLHETDWFRLEAGYRPPPCMRWIGSV